MSISSAEPTVLRRVLAAAGNATAALLAFTSAAIACDTRDIALGVAAFNSCGTPWEWSEPVDIGDLYACDAPECGPDTVLRVTRVEMNPDDKLLDTAALLADWEERVIPAEMNGFSFSMIASISTEQFGSERGVYIPLEVTNPQGSRFNSLAFRVPLDGFYLVVNATGATEAPRLRGFLETALQNMTIAKEHRP